MRLKELSLSWPEYRQRPRWCSLCSALLSQHMVWQRNNQKGGAQNGFFFIFAEMVYPKEHAIFPNDITQPRVPNENQSFTSRIPPLSSQKFVLEAIHLTKKLCWSLATLDLVPCLVNSKCARACAHTFLLLLHYYISLLLARALVSYTTPCVPLAALP